MHARLPQHTRRQAPGIAKPLHRLRGRGHADAAAIPAGGGGVARVAGIIDADLVGPGALDVAEAAAEGGLGGDGHGAVAGLHGGDAGEDGAFLAGGAGALVGCEGAGSLAGPGAEVGVVQAAADIRGGLDADFLL